jgi:O-antigen/teichoic acid export membrane protein
MTFLRNILSTWTGYFVTLLVAFLLSPFVVHQLGDTGYGIWTLILSLTGYLGMLDVGIRSSVARFVARHMALGDHDKVNSTVSTAAAMLAAAGGLALLIALGLSAGFDRFFQVDHALQPAARTALLFATITISITLPVAPFTALITSLERFDLLTGISIAAAISRALLAVAVLKSGYGLVALSLVILTVGAGEGLAIILTARWLYPRLRVGRLLVDSAVAKELAGFGIYRFIWIVANQLIFYSDSLVIGIFLNAAAITYFSIAGALINYGRNIISIAVDTLLPSASRLHGQNDMHGLRQLHIFGTRLSLLIGLPICSGLLFLGKQFITLWMGPGYEFSAMLLMILTLAQITSMPQYVSSLILVGMAHHKVLAILAMGEGIINIGGSVLLISHFGLTGVAWATVIPHIIGTGLLIPLYTLRVLDQNVKEYLIKGWLRPVLCVLPAVLLCYGFSTTMVNLSWRIFGMEVLVVAATVAATSYTWCLDAAQKTAVRTKIRWAMARVIPATGGVSERV